MQIYLLRHGIAEDGKAGQRDSERALTPEGIRKLRVALKRAKLAGVAPSLIVTSPYRRAVETAELAAKVLAYQGELLRTKALEPDSRPDAVWDEIRVHRDAAQILLSGHEPLMSELASHLLSCPALMIDFKKGALMRIDMDQLGTRPHGIMKWLLAPRLSGSE